MLILVDGDNVVWRYVGYSNVACSGYIIRDIFDKVEKFNAEAVIIVWDGGSSRRKEIFSGYKAKRDIDIETLKRKESLRIDAINTFRLCGIPQCIVEKEEGDDVIAKFVNDIFKNDSIVIISTDRDFYSLLDKTRVVIWNGKELITEEVLLKEYGIGPRDWIKLRSLAGDASDNIGGIRGIGIRKGLKILEQDKYEDYADREDVRMSKQLLEFLDIDEDKVVKGMDFGNFDRFKIAQMVEAFGLGEDGIVKKSIEFYNRDRIKQWRCSFLFEDMSICSRCSLRKTVRNVVCWDGDIGSKILFIGEAPGEEEDDSGIPFVGKAGKILDGWLYELGLDRKDVLVSNVCWCRPSKEGKNRKPTESEISFCEKFGIQRLIRYVMPELVICLGEVASSYIFGRKVKPTREYGGYKLNRYGISFDAWVLLHPAVLLYEGAYKTVIADQLKELKKYIKENKSV